MWPTWQGTRLLTGTMQVRILPRQPIHKPALHGAGAPFVRRRGAFDSLGGPQQTSAANESEESRSPAVHRRKRVRVPSFAPSTQPFVAFATGQRSALTRGLGAMRLARLCRASPRWRASAYPSTPLTRCESRRSPQPHKPRWCSGEHAVLRSPWRRFESSSRYQSIPALWCNR